MKLSCVLAVFFTFFLRTILVAGAPPDPDEKETCRLLLTQWEHACSWLDHCTFTGEERTVARSPSLGASFSTNLIQVSTKNDGSFDLLRTNIPGADGFRTEPDPKSPYGALTARVIYRAQAASEQLVNVQWFTHNSDKKMIVVMPPAQAAAMQRGATIVDGPILRTDEPQWSYLLEHLDSVHHRHEQCGDILAEVLSATTPNGEVTVFLDPTHGMNPCRIQASIRPGDLWNGQKLPYDMKNQHGKLLGRVESVELTVDQIQFQQVDNLWVCCGFHLTGKNNGGGAALVTGDTTYERSHIDLHPTFANTNAFVIDVPNGTPVVKSTLDNGIEKSGVKLVWKNGAVVAAPDGKTIDGIDKDINELKGSGR